MLTPGNLRNGHIYVSEIQSLLPGDVFGGSRKDQPADKLLTVAFDPGQTVQTDIPTDARTGRPRGFLRERAAVRDFFERTGAEAGDHVRICRTAPYTFHISLVKA